MFKSRAPGNLTVKFFEDGDNAAGDQFALRFVLGFKDIKRIDVVGVGGIEVAAIVEAV